MFAARGRRSARPALAVVSALLLASSCAQPQHREAKAPAAPAIPAPAPLAEARAEWAALTVQVLSATRTGGILDVQLALVNNSGEPLDVGNRFASDPADRGTLADAVVVEASGMRKYFVLRDRENRPAATVVESPIGPGARRGLLVRFPAPPRGISRITIQIPHVPPLAGVAISP